MHLEVAGINDDRRRKRRPFRLHRLGKAIERIPRREIPSTDFCNGRDPPAMIMQLSARSRSARELRAMCEASRGRQLRLIRAETDSGRSDGLLNALTCRQPSARLHFLRRKRRDRTFRAYRPHRRRRSVRFLAAKSD